MKLSDKGNRLLRLHLNSKRILYFNLLLLTKYVKNIYFRN